MILTFKLEEPFNLQNLLPLLYLPNLLEFLDLSNPLLEPPEPFWIWNSLNSLTSLTFRAFWTLGRFNLYLFSFNFPLIYISKWLVQESFHNQFKIF